jgi:hypothetical protein
VLGYANTTEPFQDVQQAISTLKICDKFDIPLFIQLKGVHFNDVCSYLEPLADNVSVFVSIPTDDERAVKRFEPGTPTIAERLKIIEWLTDRQFWTIAALSPYHESLCQDPYSFVNSLADMGINEVFLDRLHLNQRQFKIAPDRVMAEMAGGRHRRWSPRAIEHVRAIYAASVENSLEFFANGFEAVCYGFSNTLPTISPTFCFSRGISWPYHDGNIFQVLENLFYDDDVTPLSTDPTDSIIVTWSDALTIMHENGSIDQPFSYSSLMDIVPVYKHIPDAWKRHIGDPAPMSSWFQALWNSPYAHQFCWRHPFIAVACDMKGVPYLDSDGNIVGLFDANCFDRYKKIFRKVESLAGFRRLTHTLENPDVRERKRGKVRKK